MIARALNALGLMRVSELSDKPMQARTVETLEQHIMDANIAKSDAEWWARERIETLRARLDAERKAPGIDWEAKFKLAATDLADATFNIEQQARVIAQLHADVGTLRPDALLWRAARDKRAARKGVSRG